MKTIIIIEGVTLTATRSTIDRYLAEKREAEIEARILAWLADPVNWHDECYSDIYKDVYGVRPHW
jgi:poly(3-hydroxyalkanoate) synthetase